MTLYGGGFALNLSWKIDILDIKYSQSPLDAVMLLVLLIKPM